MDQAVALAAAQGQRDPSARSRRHYRHSITSLAYVRLDHGNGGIIRNLSESGIAIQAVGRLHKDQLVHLRFELLRPKIRIDITGQVAWADKAGQAGLHFVDLRPRLQRQLRDWIFADLLAIAVEFGPNRSPIFGLSTDEPTADGLIIPAALKSTVVEEEQDEVAASAPIEMLLRLTAWPADIYPKTLARFVDSVIVVSAVLLFAVIAIETVGVFPTATVALAMGLGLTSALGAVYYFLFRYVMGMTVGRYLAKLAAADVNWLAGSDEDVPRFR